LIGMQGRGAEDRAAIGQVADRGAKIDILRIESMALRGEVVSHCQHQVPWEFALHLDIALDLVGVFEAGREGIDIWLDD